MQKIIILGLLLSLSFAPNPIDSQIKISDVSIWNFKGATDIKSDKHGETAGYFTYFVSEQLKRGMLSLTFLNLNPDLSTNWEQQVTLHKNDDIYDIQTNDTRTLAIVKRPQKKGMQLIMFDEEGTQIEEKVILIEKLAEANEIQISPLEDGFVIFKLLKDKKWGFEVLKYDNQLVKKWEHQYVPEKGSYEIASKTVNQDHINVLYYQKASALSKKSTTKLLAIDGESGEEVFNQSTYNGEFTGLPTTILRDEKTGDYMLAGMYFDGEKVSSANSDGIFFQIMADNGEIKKESYQSWKPNIQKYLKSSSVSATISGKPKVMFHDIVKDEKSGNYIVIGETFRMAYPVVANPLRNLSGKYIGSPGTNNKPMQFEVLDYLFFEFDKETELVNISKLAKPAAKINCYPPYNLPFGAGLAIAKEIKQAGFFGYWFVKENEEKEKFLISTYYIGARMSLGITKLEVNQVMKFKSNPLPLTFGLGFYSSILPGPGNTIMAVTLSRKSLTFTPQELNF